jgi:hypothetical protein
MRLGVIAREGERREMAIGDPPANRQQMFEAMDKWGVAAKNVLEEAEAAAKEVRVSLRSFLTSDVTAYQVSEMAAASAAIEALLKECRKWAGKAESVVRHQKESEATILATVPRALVKSQLPDDEYIANRAIEVAQFAVKADEVSKQLDRAVDDYLKIVEKYRSGGRQGPDDVPDGILPSGRASRLAF